MPHRECSGRPGAPEGSGAGCLAHGPIVSAALVWATAGPREHLSCCLTRTNLRE